ncbi:MAG TPA: GtrA family protein [Clostridiales bacterium]|jgi:putative flippase GtrA|nr:GtrA family protein [Clostridiales bacterium]
MSGRTDKKGPAGRLRGEISRYLFFGILTTLVGWAVYFALLWGGRAVFDIPADDTTSAAYIGIYTAAQIIQWVAAVLFAFYTNRKWVFTDADRSVSAISQLAVFAGGRLLTFGLDYLVTLTGTNALASLWPGLSGVYVGALERAVNLAEVISKIAAAVIVIVGNYVFSKLLVFRKKKP